MACTDRRSTVANKLVCYALAITAVTSAGCSHAASSVLAAGAFEYAHDQIFVPLELGNERLLALLDTGASASAISAELTKRLSLPVVGQSQVQGTTATIDSTQVRVEGMRWWGATLPALTIPSYSLGNLAGPAGQPVDFILGADVLRGYAVDIDFDKKHLELLQNVPNDERSIPVTLDNGIPVVEASVDGQPCRLRIDTGASLFDTDKVYINIVEKTLRRLHPNGPTKPVEQLGAVGAGGQSVSIPVYSVGEVRLGPARFSDARVIVQPPVGYFSNPDAIGFLGDNLLEKLGRVVIDYPGRRLFFPAPLTQPVSAASRS